MTAQPDMRCPHCRLGVAIQEWMADPEGAQAHLALYRAENPDVIDTDASLSSSQMAFGFGEAFADAINSAVLQHLDIAVLMNSFVEAFNKRSTRVQIPLTYGSALSHEGATN